MVNESTDDANTPPVSTRTVTVRSSSRSQWTAIVMLSLAMAFVVFRSVAAQYDANVATGTAQQLAGPLAELCASDPSVRTQVGDEKCDTARDVHAESPAAAPPGGRDGRGIVATALTGGHLMVTYTDGEHVDLGVVVGTPGPTGPTGAVGPEGRGILDASLDDGGRLVVRYADGATEVVGQVVGRDGVDGRGVDRVEARDGRLLVYYTTAPNDAIDVGPLPVARGIETLDLNLGTCIVTIHYTDGTQEDKLVSGCTSSGATPPPDDSSTVTTTTSDGTPTPTG